MTRYRCCGHCDEDVVHAVEPDDHEVPCNAPNSQGCVGRKATPTTTADPERAALAEGSDA